MGRTLKIGLGLLLIGMGIIAVFAALSQDSAFAITSNEDYNYHELLYNYDTYQNLSFDLENRNVYIRQSEDEQIRIQFYDTDKLGIHATSMGDTLNIIGDKTPWYKSIFSGWTIFTNHDYFKVYLYLPTNVSGYNLTIDSSNGEISALSVDSIKNMDVHTSNGKITCESSDMNIFTGTTSNGTVIFTNFNVISSITIATSNGKMYFTNVTGESLDASSSNGSVHATNISFSNCNISTSNGSITATVNGIYDDYRVLMSTSNGHKTLNAIRVEQSDFNTSKTNKVNLRTSNGDVDLTFTE